MVQRYNLPQDFILCSDVFFLKNSETVSALGVLSLPTTAPKVKPTKQDDYEKTN
jgi:hypothetical protein